MTPNSSAKNYTSERSMVPRAIIFATIAVLISNHLNDVCTKLTASSPVFLLNVDKDEIPTGSSSSESVKVAIASIQLSRVSNLIRCRLRKNLRNYLGICPNMGHIVAESHFFLVVCLSRLVTSPLINIHYKIFRP